ncbi:hypothetical protein C0Q58_17065 [Streptomyces albidoflavus]|uniref:DUF397 domain-containing protein n=1 Tax=Streptomyces albidoflavus TaxID=1886 RepID=UPI00101E2C3F|nr:hypothetical protein C0Q58_17065 [Streptomyces albidoflavus]
MTATSTTPPPLTWVKSSHSMSDGDWCVEWAPDRAALPGEVLVRDRTSSSRGRGAWRWTMTQVARPRKAS